MTYYFAPYLKSAADDKTLYVLKSWHAEYVLYVKFSLNFLSENIKRHYLSEASNWRETGAIGH